MNRDLVFATLVLGLCGSVIWVTGWASGVSTLAARSLGESGRADELRSWRRLWSPLVPAAVALAALCGWTIQEPRSTDELLRPVALLGLIPLALVWLRAVFRAARALVPPRVAPVAATVGLLRPRVVMDAGLCRRLERLPLDAALAHERAHARHRDPLRIWLAQIATDLQWPNPSAQRRFEGWAEALELARDEEVRAGGVRGEDLAAALVAAVRLARESVLAAAARLTGPERALCERIDRLLEPLRAMTPLGRRWLLPLTLLTALAAAGVFGVARGDLLVRALPLIVG
ncbi:MAG TPA: M56 family metallopeptidase [Polyangia bacterium]|nr:M56 family metallopeptidase [Polyangia bacterium]